MRISDWSSDVCSSDLSAARSCCTLNVRKLLQPSGRTLADCQTLVTARPRPGSDFIKVAAATNAVPERADAADAGARRWHGEYVVQLCWLGSGHEGVTLAFRSEEGGVGKEGGRSGRVRGSR